MNYLITIVIVLIILSVLYLAFRLAIYFALDCRPMRMEQLAKKMNLSFLKKGGNGEYNNIFGTYKNYKISIFDDNFTSYAQGYLKHTYINVDGKNIMPTSWNGFIGIGRIQRLTDYYVEHGSKRFEAMIRKWELAFLAVIIMTGIIAISILYYYINKFQ